MDRLGFPLRDEFKFFDSSTAHSGTFLGRKCHLSSTSLRCCTQYGLRYLRYTSSVLCRRWSTALLVGTLDCSGVMSRLEVKSCRLLQELLNLVLLTRSKRTKNQLHLCRFRFSCMDALHMHIRLEPKLQKQSTEHLPQHTAHSSQLQSVKTPSFSQLLLPNKSGTAIEQNENKFLLRFSGKVNRNIYCNAKFSFRAVYFW